MGAGFNRTPLSVLLNLAHSATVGQLSSSGPILHRSFREGGILLLESPKAMSEFPTVSSSVSCTLSHWKLVDTTVDANKRGERSLNMVQTAHASGYPRYLDKGLGSLRV